jgi:hypothetical protein
LKNINKLLLFLGFILSSLFSHSLIAEQLLNDKGNRFEGYEDYDISTKFRPLALHLGRIPKYKNNSILSVRFFVPEQEQYIKIGAGRINEGKRKYYMQVKKDKWVNGWQTFNSWPVNDVLIPENISSKELALRVVADKSQWLPAQVLVDQQYQQATEIYFYFYTARWISELTYSIGEFKGILKNQFGPSPFKISFPTKSLNLGENKLALAIKWKGGGASYKNYDIYFSQPLEQK